MPAWHKAFMLSLIAFTRSSSNVLNSNQLLLSIILYSSKAIDTVDHKIPLRKLLFGYREAIHMPGLYLTWMVDLHQFHKIEFYGHYCFCYVYIYDFCKCSNS